MSERDGYEPGVPCWVVAIEPDPEAAARFYAEVFGWGFAREDDYFIAQLRGSEVAAIAPMPPGVEPPPRPDWVTHVWVEDADATADAAAGAGGRIVAGPYDWPEGRLAVLADPAGAVVCAWQPGRRRGAQLVNEPGAWSMSRLDTPDVEAAKAFYGSVFGWTTESFADKGVGEITLFRLPGYVGGEPEQPVSREVIAAMAPGNAGGKARWSVDFWVGDIDTAAGAAEPAGGTVVMAPFETPLGRSAVLADPAGVTFSISQVKRDR